MKKIKKAQAKVLEYNLVILEEDEGGYSVSVPDLPGCYSQGDTFEEARENIKEAIELYLEDVKDDLYYRTPEMTRRQVVSRVQIQI